MAKSPGSDISCSPSRDLQMSRHLLLVASLLLVATPGARSSFLLLVVRPGAPSSVLVHLAGVQNVFS